jgi:ribonucleoside-diphosphate reductase alpha chain
LIGGTSPSIEPWKANAFTSRTRAGSHLTKNKYLEEELEILGKNTPEVWSSIITGGGSVQHLEFLSDHIKDVFKTAIELDQDVIVKQAGDRQKYLCQGQSLNIFFPAGATKSYLHKVHFNAWLYGTKGLYYLRTETSNKAENVAAKVARERLAEFSDTNSADDSQDDCVACQG